MPNGISKRQQLRNEKALAELVRSVPGNDRCADCEALTPGWASWNMGIFLCMRCASIHRKLGTHISKVKSLSMDTWTSEQVDNMKSHGNLLMNKIYNPKNVKPPVPTDVDETDSTLERYIRAKYQYRSLEDGKPKPPSRSDESYNRPREATKPRSPPESPEGSPPPLPPKSSKFLGLSLRSSSSTSNLRRFGTKKSPSTSDWSPPPPKRSTSGLGAPVADVTTASFESKMAALREMGFTNDRRNEMVLKGLNEDLDRSIDTLQRLGEGNGLPITRSKTPTASRANNSEAPPPMPPRPATQGNASSSNNPFDKLDANSTAQAQQVPPVPRLQTGAATSYNPFDQSAQAPRSAQPLETSFQGLQVTQPLFPHSTGGLPQHANSLPQPLYQQPYTPPVTATFAQNGYTSSPQAVDSTYNPFFQTAPQQAPQQAPMQNGMANQPFANTGAAQNNPFFNNPPQNGIAQPQLQPNGVPRPPQHANTMPSLSQNSIFGTSPGGAAPAFQGQPQQQPQSFGQGSHNPFQQNGAPPTPQSAGFGNPFPSQQPQPQQLVPQATGRVDKGSILSLYGSNAPPPMPTIPQQQVPQPVAATSPVPQLSNSFNSTPQSQPGFSSTPQPSTGSFANGSRNPFDGPAPTAPPAPAGSGLAAQAGINTFQPSSGLGLGIGANGSSVQPQATGTGGLGAGLGAGVKSNNPFPTSNNPFPPANNNPFPTTNSSPFPPASSNPFPPTNNNPFPPTNNNPFPPASSNPFPTSQPANSAFPRTHMSQPSVDINGFQTGRHSPDAFASLSARYG